MVGNLVKGKLHYCQQYRSYFQMLFRQSINSTENQACLSRLVKEVKGLNSTFNGADINAWWVLCHFWTWLCSTVEHYWVLFHAHYSNQHVQPTVDIFLPILVFNCWQLNLFIPVVVHSYYIPHYIAAAYRFYKSKSEAESQLRRGKTETVIRRRHERIVRVCIFFIST